MVGSIVSSLTFSTDTAYAAPTAQECWDGLNGKKDFILTRENTATQNLYNQCLGTFCTVTVNPNSAENGKDITCKNPSSLGDATQQASAAKAAPVTKLICGTGGGGDAALSAYQTCVSKLNTSFASCDTTGGGATSAMVAPTADVAKCLKSKYPTYSLADLTAAIEEGRGAATKITDDAIAAQALKDNQDKCAKNDPPQDYSVESKGCVDKGTDGTVTCNTDVLGAVGWVVCPVMHWLSRLTDNVYDFIKQFLEVKTNVYDTSSKTYEAWAPFRDLANVMFIVGFVIVVLSQVTGMGISNYGIKRMLPRLIVMAILVNSSYLICQLAVDISNILGATMVSFFDSVAPKHAPTTWETLTNFILSGGTIGGAGLAAGAVVIAVLLMYLAVSIPVLLAALLALVMIALILIARQAIIVLLIVVSPVAIALNLLPNTEQWFKKWQKMFFSLLMVYPVIGALFGAGNLASSILGQADGVEMTIAALGAAILPLFVVPSLLKGSLAATGALGAKLQGLSDKASGRVGKKIGSDTQFGAFAKARQRNAQIKRAQIQGGVFKGKSPIGRGMSRLNNAINNSRLSGSMGTRTAQQGAALANKLEIENVDAANAQIEQANVDVKDLEKLASGGKAGGLDGGDAATQAAAMTQLAKRGEMASMATAWDAAKGGKSENRKAVANALARSPDRPQFLPQSSLQEMRDGGGKVDSSTGKRAPIKSFQAAALEGIQSGAYSPEGMSKASAQELGYAHQVASDHYTAHKGTDPNAGVAMQKLINAAHAAKSDSSISKNISKNGDVIDSLAAGKLYTP